MEIYEKTCPKCGGSGLYNNNESGKFSSLLNESCCVCSEKSYDLIYGYNHIGNSKTYLSSSSFSSTLNCDVCNGTGKVDWVDIIKKGVKE